MPAPARPLDADVARICASGTYLPVARTDQPLPSPWLPCTDLLTTGGLPAWTGRIRARLVATHGQAPHPSVAPTYAMGWYLDAVARTGATWFGLCERVPDLLPAALALHENAGGWPDAVAVRSDRFWCLPHDDAASHPDAVVLPDRQALGLHLVMAVRAHAALFHAAFTPCVSIGSRQRWGMVDDVLEAALWAGGELRGDPAAGQADAAALVGPNPTRVRRSCCFAYRLDEAFLCTRCPRRLRSRAAR